MWKISNQPFAAEATLHAHDPSTAALSALVEQLAALSAQLATLRPEFEYTGPRTFGGIPAALPYTMLVPFSGPCEVQVGIVTTLGAGAQNVTVTTEGSQTAADIAGVAVTRTLDGSANFWVSFGLNGNGTTHGAGSWYPIASEKLYLYLGGASTSGTYVTVQFRRRINAVGVPSMGY